MDIATAGQAAAIERMRALPGERQSGPGWSAVRTGRDSNDLNGVVLDAVPTAADVADLLMWLAAPSSWLTATADPALTAVLVEAGLHPERTGSWCGRTVPPAQPAPGVERVEDLDEWSAVALACGWAEPPPYVGERRPHWVARRDGVAVGMASAWRGEVCELVDVAVLPEHRRRGVGAALVETVLAWADEQRATEIVAAPSPDGWALLSTRGFASAPVVPDLTFYAT